MRAVQNELYQNGHLITGFICAFRVHMCLTDNRGGFRNLSNISDGVFLRKWFTVESTRLGRLKTKI